MARGGRRASCIPSATPRYRRPSPARAAASMCSPARSASSAEPLKRPVPPALSHRRRSPRSPDAQPLRPRPIIPRWSGPPCKPAVIARFGAGLRARPYVSRRYSRLSLTSILVLSIRLCSPGRAGPVGHVQTQRSGGQDAVARDRTPDGQAVPLRVQLAAGAPIDAVRLSSILRDAGFVPQITLLPDPTAEPRGEVALSIVPAADAETDAPPANLIVLPVAELQAQAAHDQAAETLRPAAGGELPAPSIQSDERHRPRARAPHAPPPGEVRPLSPTRVGPAGPTRGWGRHSTRLPNGPDDELAAVYASLSCGAALFDEQGRVRFANAALLELLGATGGEPAALQRALARLRVYDERGEPLPHDAWATAVALRTGRSVQGMVVAVDRPDGSRRWLTIDAVPLRDRSGRPCRVVVTFFDITAFREERERALRLASIVENCNEAVTGCDLEGRVQIWNPAAERLYGYSAAEILGQRLDRVMLGDAAAGFPERLRRLAAGEWLRQRESERRRKDGPTVRVWVSSAPLHDSTGRIVGAAGIARDLTLRRSHEARLLRLAAIIESADDAVLACDRDLRIDTCNPSAARLFGCSAEEIAGQPIERLLPSDQHGDLPALVQQVLAGASVQQHEARHRRPDGSQGQSAISMSPLRDAAGTVAGAALVVRDITAQKAAEAALRASEERYRALFENAKDVVVTIDLEGRVTSLNRAGEQLAGVPREQIVGRHLTELLQPDSFAQSPERNRQRAA